MAHAEPPRQTARIEHFLPRLLLKGFAIDSAAKELQVYRFAPGRPGHPVNTRKVAAERNFYGVARGIDIEQKFGDAETRYAELIQRLRDGRCDAQDSSLIAEFVDTLMLRGKYLRATMGLAAEHAFDAFLGASSDAEAITAFKAQIHQEVLRRPDVRALPARQQKILAELLPQMLANLDVGGLTQQFLTDARRQLDIRTLTRDSHSDALARSFQERVEPKITRALAWHVQKVTDSMLILGDVGPVAMLKGKPGVHILNRDIPATEAVILPIASGVVLVGTAPGVVAPDIVAESLNVQTATICREFFIASRNGAAEGRYASLIGRHADPFADMDLESLARQVLRDHAR